METEPKDKIKEWENIIDKESDPDMLSALSSDIRYEQDYFEEVVRMYDDLMSKIENKEDALEKEGEQ